MPRRRVQELQDQGSPAHHGWTDAGARTAHGAWKPVAVQKRENPELPRRALFGCLGMRMSKASQRGARPAGRRGANVLRSDMCQQYPDAPLTKTKALRVCGFPRHKPQILGAGPWTEVDIRPGPLVLLPHIF